MLWCRLFRSVSEPSWKREATRAEVWLQETEAEEEVLRPSDFRACDCRSFQAADLDDHAPDCAARLTDSQPQCQSRGPLLWFECTKPSGHVGHHLSSAGSFWTESQATDPRSHEEVSPTVGDVTPPWGDANQLLDHIAELVDYHQYHQRSTVMFGYCTGCSWTAWGEFTQSTRRAHAGHVAELVMDMVQAEHRIQRKGDDEHR